jgi:hypothetical protein
VGAGRRSQGNHETAAARQPLQGHGEGRDPEPRPAHHEIPGHGHTRQHG